MAENKDIRADRFTWKPGDIIINKKETMDEDLVFYKNDPNDKVWWVDNPDTIGEHLFSIDKKKVYNLFADYPHNLTKEEKAIFDAENPFWVEFFSDRQPQK